jgi:transposase
MGIQACPGAHFLARILLKQGHDVKLMPAEYVRPFVKSNKNDYVDAEAIAEAVQRPTMRFVPVKNEAQLDLQSLHRVRDRWIGRKTAVINQLRGFLLDHGITVAAGPSAPEATASFDPRRCREPPLAKNEDAAAGASRRMGEAGRAD